MNKFCPDAPNDFMAKLSLLIKHIKENYDRTEFDLWEEPSESYSVDLVKHDFAIVCSNFFITDDTMIKYFDEYGVVGSAYPHYYSMKKISSAYKELKGLLPEDYGKLE